MDTCFCNSPVREAKTFSKLKNNGLVFRNINWTRDKRENYELMKKNQTASGRRLKFPRVPGCFNSFPNQPGESLYNSQRKKAPLSSELNICRLSVSIQYVI